MFVEFKKLVLALLALAFISPMANAQSTNEAVILVHGFLGAPSDLGEIELALIEEGYDTINVQYQTRQAHISELADYVFARALLDVNKNQTVNVVTHSMGGLLLRSFLERRQIPQLSRVVMIAPPNQGSQVAKELAEYPLYRQYFGPAGVELGALSLQPRKVGDYELGIIAGTASVNPVFSRILPGIDDGYVALSSTPLDGMNDFITVPSSHGLITANDSTIKQTLLFIKTAQFDHSLEIRGFPFSTEDFFPTLRNSNATR